MKVTFKGIALATVVLLYGYTRYTRFEKFINSLKLNLLVLKIENGIADVVLQNLTHKNIPYSIESVKLINDQNLLAISQQEKVSGLIVPNATTPLKFDVINPATIEDISNANIAVTFNYFGFTIERLYKVESLTEDAIEVDQDNNSSQTITASCGCGC